MSLPGRMFSVNCNRRVEKGAGNPLRVSKYLAQYVVEGH